MFEIRTERLLLRPWRDTDRAPYAALNLDPEVMEHFPSVRTPEESDASVDRQTERLAETGYCMAAAERIDTGEFIGFIGLQDVPFEAHFTPAVEIGWRLARAQWGRGYATEGARGCLEFARARGLGEVVAMVATRNLRSQAVAERLGMRRDPDGDFDHPLVEAGHPKARHLLYRIEL
ncbi:GNAT family N-acetyltransferase [Actinocorallia lasiicapitis]